MPAFATLFTYQFFHADIAHLLGNMVVLVGVRRRRRAGARPLALSRFLSLCGVVGGLVFIANDLHARIELIGASGAIAGLVVAYVMLRPCAKITVLLGIIPLRISAYWVVGLFVLTQLWNLGASSKSEVALLVPLRRHAGRRRPVSADEAAGVKLFQCMQPVPDTVVQIGPNPVARAARLDNFR